VGVDIGWQALAMLACAALLAGWVDAVVGGGGLIQLPSLLIGLPSDTPVPVVSGTNKVSSAAGTLMAAQTYARRVPIPWGSAIPLVVLAFAGSTLGARLVGFMPREWFTPLVLVVVIGVNTWTFRRPALGLESRVVTTGAAHHGRLAAIGAGIGFYDGFVGPGTGTFFVIALVGAMGYEFLTASALTKLANLTTNVAAIVVFASHGQVFWRVALVMAAANLTGGLVGARTAIRHGNAFVRRVFLVVLTGLGIKLAWDTVTLLVGAS